MAVFWTPAGTIPWARKIVWQPPDGVKPPGGDSQAGAGARRGQPVSGYSRRMKSGSISVQDLAGVFAVPPLPRRADSRRSLNFDAAECVARHIEAGGSTRFPCPERRAILRPCDGPGTPAQTPCIPGRDGAPV